MATITNARGYPIGVMSRETGVNIETIRYYERVELMPKPDRTVGGNRQYAHDHLKRLFFIKRSRELGFSIDEIRALIAAETISGGMIPKVEACIHAVESGATSAHMLDGRIPHVLLLELFTDAGIGTMITGDLPAGEDA